MWRGSVVRQSVAKGLRIAPIVTSPEYLTLLRTSIATCLLLGTEKPTVFKRMWLSKTTERSEWSY